MLINQNSKKDMWFIMDGNKIKRVFYSLSKAETYMQILKAGRE